MEEKQINGYGESKKRYIPLDYGEKGRFNIKLGWTDL